MGRWQQRQARTRHVGVVGVSKRNGISCSVVLHRPAQLVSGQPVPSRTKAKNKVKACVFFFLPLQENGEEGTRLWRQMNNGCKQPGNVRRQNVLLAAGGGYSVRQVVALVEQCVNGTVAGARQCARTCVQ